MTQTLLNKVAIITGGASGIGKETVKRFLEEGAKVVVADFNQQTLDETVAEFSSLGAIVGVLSDVRQAADNEKMFDMALENYGQVDVLVCNAGVLDGFALLENISDQLWENTFAINVTAPMQQMRRAVKEFAKNEHGGSIIVTASAAGLGGGRSGVSYTASKRAVIGLAQNVAFSYADKGVRVNVVAPGGVATNIMKTSANVDEEGSHIFHKGMSLMPRVGMPTEFSGIMTFLASDQASFINGAVIPVDGGWSAY